MQVEQSLITQSWLHLIKKKKKKKTFRKSLLQKNKNEKFPKI